MLTFYILSHLWKGAYTMYIPPLFIITKQLYGSLVLTFDFLSIEHAELNLERRGTESTDFCYMHPISLR